MPADYEWSPGARAQLNAARASQPTFDALMRLERAIDEAIELITTFPEAAPQYLEFDRPDFRSVPVEGYRLIYMFLEDRLLIISFKPARASSALD